MTENRYTKRRAETLRVLLLTHSIAGLSIVKYVNIDSKVVVSKRKIIPSVLVKNDFAMSCLVKCNMGA